jgi:hypothetical protein
VVNINLAKCDKAFDSDLTELKGLICIQSSNNVYEIMDGNKEIPLPPSCDQIVIQTHSIFHMLFMLSLLIEVPQEHNQKGMVEPTDRLTTELENIRENIHLKIYCNKELPPDTFVSVKHNGYWFFIKNTDIESKDEFSHTQAILSMAETGAVTGTPILTLPLQ